MMMKIIGPNAIQPIPSPVGGQDELGLVAVILRYEQDVSFLWKRGVNFSSKFFEEVRGAVVHHRMRRVQAQSVDVILVYPMQGVFYKKMPCMAAVFIVKVDAVAPGAFMSGREIPNPILEAHPIEPIVRNSWPCP